VRCLPFPLLRRIHILKSRAVVFFLAADDEVGSRDVPPPPPSPFYSVFPCAKDTAMTYSAPLILRRAGMTGLFFSLIADKSKDVRHLPHLGLGKSFRFSFFPQLGNVEAFFPFFFPSR